jgi:adenylate kinase
MEMSKTRYSDLMLRFAKELHDVGVTDSMKKIVESQYTRTPNVSGCDVAEDIRKFTYLHEGYMIEAVQTVKFKVKKCK